MATMIRCALDGGRLQFTATVDNENRWTISEDAPRALADNLIPDLKRAGSLVCAELTNMDFDNLSERYAARAIHRLRYIFSSMEIIPPEEVEPPAPKKRVEKTQTKKVSDAKTKTTPKRRTRKKTPAKASEKQVVKPENPLDTDKQ